MGRLTALVLAAAVLTGCGAAEPASTSIGGPSGTVTLDNQTINLADGHLLHLGIVLRLTNGTGPADIDGGQASRLADQLLTGRDEASLTSATGRQRVYAELEQQIEDIPAYEGKVSAVYISDFATL